jgi:hypothetical protein
MAEKSTSEKAREKIKKLFEGSKGVAPGASSNKLLEGISDKLQEVIGRKLKKNGG